MQYKNPVDAELVQASAEAYKALAAICAYIGMEPEAELLTRLKGAVTAADVQMRMQAETEGTEYISPVAPPVSME